MFHLFTIYLIICLCAHTEYPTDRKHGDNTCIDRIARACTVSRQIDVGVLLCRGRRLVLRAKLETEAEAEVVAQEVVRSMRVNWLRPDECDPPALSARTRLSRVAHGDSLPTWVKLMASTPHKHRHTPDVTV